VEVKLMGTTLQELDIDVITRSHLERGLESLEQEFAGMFSSEMIERYMAESLEQLPGERISNFVPLFVHRFARERLRALGQVEGSITKDVPEVLFVCVQNAGRSQMAAALLDDRAGGRLHVRSAGSAPGERRKRHGSLTCGPIRTLECRAGAALPTHGAEPALGRLANGSTDAFMLEQHPVPCSSVPLRRYSFMSG